LRRLIAFPCAGDTLVGTLDQGDRTTGLLIVSGGNEVRMGAHRGMASLAARLAAAGIPVFRYDRRGIGDSSGENRGFLESAPDIAAAAATFAAEAGVRRLVAFGNCDAATALALFHGVAGIDALILANPWVVDSGDDLPPTAAIRARYAERLRDPRQWARLVRGGVNLRKLTSGLSKIFAGKSELNSALTERFVAALDGNTTPVTIILASRDATALAFMDAIKAVEIDATIQTIDTASHSFARESDQAALESIVRELLA
jgi:exosortase A-associated hydrolase 1